MKNILVATLIAMTSTSAIAANVTDKTDYIEFSGEVTRGDAEKLNNIIEATGIKVVHFNSPGGAALEGFAIGGVLKRNEVKGVIPEKAACMSACAWAFLASKEKDIDGLLGFHTAFVSNKNGKPATSDEINEDPSFTLRGGQFIGATNAAYFFELGYRFQLQAIIQYVTDPTTYFVFRDETDLARFEYEKAEDYTKYEELPKNYIGDRIAGTMRIRAMRSGV